MAKYCTSCGTEIEEDNEFCPNCGVPVKEEVVEKEEETTSEKKETTVTGASPAAKSKITAGILGIFFGCFGVHNFYLGYTGKAIAQLLLTLVGWILCFTGPFAAWIWGLIEGVLILTGSIDKDANGVPLIE